MFERTRSGQQNRATFFGADLTCYVEGGGHGNNFGPDMTFWANIIQICRPDLRIKCIARGGKPILEKLAQDIIQKDVQSAIVAMDCDYDRLLSQKVDDHRVLYTHGYSWENDLYNAENMLRVFAAISHAPRETTDPYDFILSEFERVHKLLLHPCRADFVALQSGSSILPREAPGRIVSYQSQSDQVSIDRNQVIEISMQKKGGMTIKCDIPHKLLTDTARDCVGHILSLAASYIMKSAIRRYIKKMNLSSDHVRDVALQVFPLFLTFSSTHDVSAHHHNQCKRVYMP